MMHILNYFALEKGSQYVIEIKDIDIDDEFFSIAYAISAFYNFSLGSNLPFQMNTVKLYFIQIYQIFTDFKYWNALFIATPQKLYVLLMEYFYRTKETSNFGYFISSCFI